MEIHEMGDEQKKKLAKVWKDVKAPTVDKLPDTLKPDMKQWGTSGTDMNFKPTSVKIVQAVVNYNKAINAAKGVVCIPYRWAAQAEGLIRSGLQNHLKKKTPLVVKESYKANLGKGCENTTFIRFEGQTNNEWFIAAHFQLVKNGKQSKND